MGGEHSRPGEVRVNQCVGDTIGPGGNLSWLTAPGGLRRPRQGHGRAVPGRPRPAVLQSHGHPDLEAGPGRAAGVGLCHSVQGTARLLAGYCKVPFEGRITGWRGSTIRLGSYPGARRRRPLPTCKRSSATRRSSAWNLCVRADAPLRLFRDRVQRPRLSVRYLLPQAPRLLAALVEPSRPPGATELHRGSTMGDGGLCDGQATKRAVL